MSRVSLSIRFVRDVLVVLTSIEDDLRQLMENTYDMDKFDYYNEMLRKHKMLIESFRLILNLPTSYIPVIE